MSLSGAYDEANVFAKILRGDIPSAKVFETETVLVFMDVFPQSPGHCLVISKTSKARNVLEVEPDILAELTAVVQKTAKAVSAALSPDGVIVSQFNGAPAGQTVFHLHFHVIPAYVGQPLRHHAERMADPGDLKGLAARIAKHMDV